MIQNAGLTENVLKVKRLKFEAILPSRAKKDDAGLDLHSCHTYSLNPGESVKVSTGIAIQIPTGFVGMIADRSSLGSKGIKTFGGIIDAGYRGEVQVILRNLSQDVFPIHPSDRVAQLLILPVSIVPAQWVTELDPSERGQGGFGSSGQ